MFTPVRSRRHEAALTFAAVAAVTAGMGPAFADEAVAARMTSLVGTWTCVSHADGKAMNYTVKYSRAGDHWLHYAADYQAGMGEPAHTEEAELGYDQKRQRWVFLNTSSTGDYFVGTSSGAPAATTQVWTTAYPADPTGGSLTIDYASPSKMTLVSKWTEKGKAMSGTDVCTKR